MPPPTPEPSAGGFYCSGSIGFDCIGATCLIVLDWVHRLYCIVPSVSGFYCTVVIAWKGIDGDQRVPAYAWMGSHHGKPETLLRGRLSEGARRRAWAGVWRAAAVVAMVAAVVAMVVAAVLMMVGGVGSGRDAVRPARLGGGAFQRPL